MKKDADHLILRITVIKNDLLWGNKKHLHPFGLLMVMSGIWFW
jgi:hypothetical protein